MMDDGTHGDGAAGDGLYGTLFTVAPGTSSGKKLLAVTVQDGDGQTALASAILTVTDTLPPAPTPTPSPTPAIGPINTTTVRQGVNGSPAPVMRRLAPPTRRRTTERLAA